VIRLALLTDMVDAARGLRRRPLRSLLSSLGIGVGVTALIAMLAISEGASRKTLATIGSLGLDTLRLEGGVPAGGNGGQGVESLFDGEDVRTLQAWLGSRGEVGAFVKEEGVEVTDGARTLTATVIGVNDRWFAAERVTLARGRFFDAIDQAEQRPYCVLGSALAAQLQADPLSPLRYANQPVTVVGVATGKGRLLTEGTGLSTLDFDNLLIIPLSLLSFPGEGGGAVDGLVIRLAAPGEGLILRMAEQVETLLRERGQRSGDFPLVVPLTLLQQARESQRLFALIMGAIAGLSLLVGGIGVMNVMLANIAEQTREIGLRMAVGAPPARIVSLYLCKAVLLTLAGGGLGVVSGVLAALLIERQAGWEVYFSPLSLLVAPLAALLTGLLFGVQPALRASSLNPAEALRDT
jgi:putative ABC transport system permease protein